MLPALCNVFSLPHSFSLSTLLFSTLQVTLFPLSLSLSPSKSDFGPVELQQNSGIEV